MWRLLAILAVLSVGLSACGGDEQRAESDRACPEGTPSLEARDVIGSTPEGYIVDRGDQQAIAEVAIVMLFDQREERARDAAALVMNDG